MGLHTEFAKTVLQCMDPESNMSTADRADTMRKFYNIADRISKKQKMEIRALESKNLNTEIEVENLELEVAAFKRQIRNKQLISSLDFDTTIRDMQRSNDAAQKEIVNLKRTIGKMKSRPVNSGPKRRIFELPSMQISQQPELLPAQIRAFEDPAEQFSEPDDF